MKSELVCWDSSVLISWIKEEDLNRMKVIESVVQNMEKGYCSLIVSTLIYTEVLASTMSDSAIGKFERFMQNKEKVGIIAVDTRVAKKAQEIRDRENKLRDTHDAIQRNRKIIETPDAIHVATAIVIGAKILHTFDKPLLSRHEKDEVEGLAITACHDPGATLPLFDS